MGLYEDFHAERTRRRPTALHAWPLAGVRSPVTIAPNLGAVRLIGSRGEDRYATFRAIYRTNPWVWASVNMIARGIARSPLHVFELAEDGNRTRVRGDLPGQVGRPSGGASLDSLLRRPNPFQSRFSLWHRTMVDRLTLGNSLWSMDRDRGMPSALWHVPWRHVWTEEGSRRPILFYELRGFGAGVGGPGRRIVPDDAVHFGRGTDPESPVGLSPLESCQHTLALHEGVVRYLMSYFENQVSPSGHFSVDNLTDEKARLIRRLILEAYASPENAGKVLVTSGKYESLTDTPDHSRVVDLVKLSREEIAAAYAIPPPVLGILERAIKSNVKELREQYVRDSLGTWVPELEDEMDAQLLTQAPSWRFLFVAFQLAEQLRPDLEARSQVYQRMRHMMSPDEQRAREDLPPLSIEGITDVPWVDSGAMPLSAFSPGQMAEQIAAKVVEKMSGSNGRKPDPVEIP